MPQDRRLAAIMFTDIVGYTAMMGRDERKAFKLLEINRNIQKPQIKKYRGEWLKEMGDGVLASFPSASDAIQCANEIQQLAKKEDIPLRIGIHEGEVVFEAGDVLGDGVNIASRIEEIAEEGSIYVSGTVYQEIRNKPEFITKFVKTVSLKNIEEPVKVYKVQYEGVERPIPSIKQHVTNMSKRKLRYYITSALIILLSIILLWIYLPQKQSVELEKSIAVLPFTNLSKDPEQEYFSDGMSEEIINKLCQTKDLRVIARTSAFAFKGKNEDIREIGRKLDVAHLLEGSVRMAGKRLRITAQLINVDDGSNQWAQSYDREIENVNTIFDIQEEISLAIVDRLKVNLLGNDKEIIAKRSTEDLEAYNLYLKGRSYSQMQTAEGFYKAMECFEQSIQSDINYADAYAGLADIYFKMSFWGNVPPNQAYPKAKEYLKKTLELDNTLAEAHSRLGFINMTYDWDFKAAEEELKLAIDLNPSSVTARIFYSYYLTINEYHDEAIKEAKLATNLDPLSSYFRTELGNAYFFAGQFDSAIEEFQMSLLMNPNYFVTHLYLGNAYLGKSMLKESMEELEKAVSLSSNAPMAVSVLACSYYLNGDLDEAARMFNSLELRSKSEYIPPMCFYLYYRTRGDFDQAFESLEQAIDKHDSFIPSFTVLPIDIMSIPNEPRFNRLLLKINLVRNGSPDG